MRGASVVFLLGCFTWAHAQFLNNRPFPTYSLENMPDTAFSCRDKILGGYYADADAQCQMFHICVKVAGVGVQDFRFLCPNGTAFDQDHQICAEWEDVDCDATTLYYSSDNFDLYRIGSGFEAKAKKYGEDEETFALQRAETGDVRINKEHQAQRVNQQKENSFYKKQAIRPKVQDNERDIFKGSSSSNFFNNRNGGKETDDDYDDNVNINQDNDQNQRRKLARKPARRPSYNQETSRASTTITTTAPRRLKITQSYNEPKNDEEPTTKTQRPSGFVNNFAGSSYIPTTTGKPTTTLSSEKYTIAINNYRLRSGPRHRAPLPDRQYDNSDFKQSQTTSEPLTVSTPAPFRQPQRQPIQTSNNNQQNYQTTTPVFHKQTTTQNYPKQTNDVKKQSVYDNNYPTTFSPKFQKQYFQQQSTKGENYPTTFSPKTNQGYNTISQVTTQYNNNINNNNNQFRPNNQQNTQQYNTQKPQTFNNQKPFSNPQNTPKSTPPTQYTPTVPKVTSTTPFPRANRYDETQYDDGSYNSKYDYDDRREDEFLKTAHSQNIAKSRNDLAQAKNENNNKQTGKNYYEAPRPFSLSPNTPKQQENTKPVQQPTTRYTNNPQPPTTRYTNNPQPPPTTTQPPKKVKDVSYDYAYYDSNVGSEPEYEIDTEIKKSTAKN